jgi:hypothetical protein
MSGRMLIPLLEAICYRSSILYFLIFWGIAGYAYRVNARLPFDDPKKGDFHPAAIFLAPIVLPFFSLGMISLFIIKAILYGVFLVVLTLALVVVRKPFILVWLDKIAKKVGGILLEANTQLIKIFFGPWMRNPRQA